MTRVQLHNRNVGLVRRTLAAQGFRVRHGGRRGGSREAVTRFDLIAEDVGVAVRVAKRSTFVYRVSVRGKRYTYQYAGYRWNLHSHGRTRLHPDFWILVAAGKPTRFFVVPGQRVRGSYTLTLRVPSNTWLLGCENEWHTIRELSIERHKQAA
jgi:hypothetical protein